GAHIACATVLVIDWPRAVSLYRKSRATLEIRRAARRLPVGLPTRLHGQPVADALACRANTPAPQAPPSQAGAFMWRIEFISSEFRPYLPEQCQANPGVYGFELAQWLSMALAEQGLATSYPLGEDWGWFIEYLDDERE